eukprot:gene8260-8935_t
MSRFPFQLMKFIWIVLFFSALLVSSINLHYPGPGPAWNRDVFHGNLTVNYDTYDYSKKNIAVIVNTQVYHVEVFAALVYYFHSLGYDVHAWVQPPWSYYQFKAKIDWISPYIDQIVYLPHEAYNKTWTTRPSLPKQVKIMVYTTGDFYADVKFMCRLGLHKPMFQRSERVMMITHHADTILNEISTECHAPKCTISFLASHVEKYAIQLHSEANTPYPAQTNYFFPIFDFPKELKINLSNPNENFFNKNRRIIIQGQASSSRRDYGALFQCLQQVEDAKYTSKLRLTIMGQGAKNLRIPFATNTTLRVLDNARFEEYFTHITHNDFVISFVPQVNISEYKANRISSSVSAAVLTEVPILLPISILSQYPCLNTSPVHLKVAGETDCQSLHNALQLTYIDYLQMKREIRYCKELWKWETMTNINNLMKKKPYDNTQESLVVPPVEEFACN